MADKTTLVHVTHEAVGKIGGIGAVLAGLFTSRCYGDAVGRSILVSPMFTHDLPVEQRLGPNGRVLYCCENGTAATHHSQSLRKVEELYNAPLVYGRVRFVNEQTGVETTPEVLLVDVRNVERAPVDFLKRRLYEQFGIRSDRYEHLWEYEQYVRLAAPALGALEAIGAVGDSTTFVAHEFMGLPTTLAAMVEPGRRCKTAFYAHEVATIRRIVENHPGHDTMFYNVLNSAAGSGFYVDDLFGRQDDFFKHTLVRAASHCDTIYAVGNQVVDELKLLDPQFAAADINVVYNGVPAYQIKVEDKIGAKAKLQLYCQRLLGFWPEVVFTHVTRLIVSKGLWRDLAVLDELEKYFRSDGRSGVFFLLSTQVARRSAGDIESMESAYGWPVAHRENWPDLSGGEAELYTLIQRFNSRSRNIKVVFINQFFEGDNCGRAMPKNLGFMDFRIGTDVEFGQSIYEPFGISQFEPLSFGGICVVSSVCGCLGFLRDITAGRDVDNVIVADYTDLGDEAPADLYQLLQIDRTVRDRIEADRAGKLARQIMTRLPKSNLQIDRLIQSGYWLARQMSWDRVVGDYLLPALPTASMSVG